MLNLECACDPEKPGCLRQERICVEDVGVKVLEDVGLDWIPIVALAKRAEGARKGREASVAELASARGTFARCRWF